MILRVGEHQRARTRLLNRCGKYAPGNTHSMRITIAAALSAAARPSKFGHVYSLKFSITVRNCKPMMTKIKLLSRNTIRFHTECPKQAAAHSINTNKISIVCITQNVNAPHAKTRSGLRILCARRETAFAWFAQRETTFSVLMRRRKAARY